MQIKTNFTPEDIRRQIVQQSTMITIGNKALAIIKERTLQGIFLPGSSPGAERYSTKPAPMPLGGFFRRVGKTRGRPVWEAIQRGTEPAEIFATARGSIWILLKGGYRRLREIAGRETDKVTLNWTGSMMRALKIIEVNVERRTVTIGFTDARSKRIASFHHQGAGKNKVKRLFVGLTEEELAKVGKEYRFIPSI